jgi:hypothetical protein
VVDRFDCDPFWGILADDMETWYKTDSGVVALLTKDSSDGPFVDVAQGMTPTLPAPCLRLMRGPELGQPLTTFRFNGADIPPQCQIDLILCSQYTSPRDAQASARGPWDTLRTLERAVLAATRRYFAMERNLSSILGAPFTATVLSITPTPGGYYPTVGSTISIQLNKVTNGN